MWTYLIKVSSALCGVGCVNLHACGGLFKSTSCTCVCVCVCVCLHTYNTYITCACIAIVHVLIMAIRYLFPSFSPSCSLPGWQLALTEKDVELSEELREDCTVAS